MTGITKRYSKQMVLIFTIVILAITAGSYTAYKQLKTNLTQIQLEKITSLKNSLKVSINKYINSKLNIVETISKSKDIKTSIIEFENAFKNISKEYKKDIDINSLKRVIQEHSNNTFYNKNIKKKNNIKEYFASTKNGQILQSLYIAQNNYKVKNKLLLEASNENLKYDKIHKKYHHLLKDILLRHNFYDIFLIDNNGNIVYSVFKELDLGTNIKNGVYKNSSLAIAYNKSMKTNKLEFSDFKAYEPSFNKPAAFFAIPIFKDSKKIGTIAFQISIEEINNIMTFNKNWESIGLGKSGESYLVGEDYFMRSDSRFHELLENKTVKALNTTIGVIEVKTPAINNSLLKIESSGIFNDYRGIEVLSSYTYIKILETTWALAVEINIEEINDKIYSTIATVLITGFLLISLSLIIIWFLLRRYIIEPIDKFEEKLDIKVKDRTKELNELNKNLQDEVNRQIKQLRKKDNILLHQARMAALGEMIGNIAHQWRQPLSIISTNASMLEATMELGLEIEEEQLSKTFKSIITQTQYLSKTIDDFRDFVENNNSNKEELNIRDIIYSSVGLVQNGIEKNNIKLVYNIEEGTILINENHIIHVLINLINNSIDAIEKKQPKDKYIIIEAFKNDKFFEISIKDSAMGIEKDILSDIFDPYTTTKHQHIGTGLGLYMSYQIITNIYEGTIVAKNKEFEYKGKKMFGASFKISLPLNYEEENPTN